MSSHGHWVWTRSWGGRGRLSPHCRHMEPFFSPVSPALGLQPRKEEHRAKNFHGCVQQSKLTPDLPLIIAVGTGPGANVKGWQPGGDKDKTHLSFVCREGFVFCEKTAERLCSMQRIIWQDRSYRNPAFPSGCFPPSTSRPERAALIPNTPIPAPRREFFWFACHQAPATTKFLQEGRLKIDPELLQTFCPACLSAGEITPIPLWGLSNSSHSQHHWTPCEAEQLQHHQTPTKPGDPALAASVLFLFG